jgi:hypothetical protein
MWQLYTTFTADPRFASSAKSYPSAAKWAIKAAPFLLNLGASDNGKSLTVPG